MGSKRRRAQKKPSSLTLEEIRAGVERLRAREREERPGRRARAGEDCSERMCLSLTPTLAAGLAEWAGRERVSPQEIVRRVLEAALSVDGSV